MWDGVKSLNGRLETGSGGGVGFFIYFFSLDERKYKAYFMVGDLFHLKRTGGYYTPSKYTEADFTFPHI